MAQPATAQPARGFQGMAAFTTVWFGQVVSLLGSTMTSFALGVWVYQRSGSATLFALIMLATMVPSILLSPVAGVYVDRWKRRTVLIASDSASAALTLVVLALLLADALAIWHIYIIVALGSVFKAFQAPAYNAAVTMMIPKEHFTRASGMRQFGAAAAQTLAPFLAGLLLALIGLPGIIAIDLATFLIALVTLTLVQVAQPASGGAARRSVIREAREGWRYLQERPGLIGLLGFFGLINLSVGIAQALYAPLVLKFAPASVFGMISAASGAGMLAGGLALSAWGGPRRRIHGVLGFGIPYGLCISLVGFQAWPWLMAAASFGTMFSVAFVNGINMVFWQTKVAPEYQGRAFSTLMMVAWACMPLSALLAGPLADGVFEPLMQPGGGLADTVGLVLGVGPGRGIGLMFVLAGLATALVAAGGYLYRPLRRIDEDLPDAVAAKPAAPAGGAAKDAPARPAAPAEAAKDAPALAAKPAEPAEPAAKDAPAVTARPADAAVPSAQS